MMTKIMSCMTLCMFIAVCSFGTQVVQAQKTLTFVGVQLDQTDYSNAGLNIGQDGYWFANFAATAPDVDNEDPFAGAVDTLPSWFSPMAFNPDLGPTNGSVDSTGGVATYDILTLPDGTTGLSGQVVDNAEAANSNNVLNSIKLGAGAPAQFLVHVVVDNDDGSHALQRLRPKMGSGLEDTDVKLVFGSGLEPFNQTADVYTFKLSNWAAGDPFRIQLKGDVVDGGLTPLFSGFAGIMIDVVPEPSSVMLLTLGALGLGMVSGRRRR